MQWIALLIILSDLHFNFRYRFEKEMLKDQLEFLEKQNLSWKKVCPSQLIIMETTMGDDLGD
jgi:hypothetical protein